MIDRTEGTDVVFDFNFNDVTGWLEFFNIPILFGAGLPSPYTSGSIANIKRTILICLVALQKFGTLVNMVVVFKCRIQTILIKQRKPISLNESLIFFYLVDEIENTNVDPSIFARNVFSKNTVLLSLFNNHDP